MGSRTRPARRGIPLPPSSGHDFNRAGKGPAPNSPQTPPFPLRRSIFHPPVPRLLLAAGGRRAPFLGFGCPRLRFSTWVLGLLSWLPGRRSPVAGRFFTPLARHPIPQAANPVPHSTPRGWGTYKFNCAVNCTNGILANTVCPKPIRGIPSGPPAALSIRLAMGPQYRRVMAPQ